MVCSVPLFDGISPSPGRDVAVVAAVGFPSSVACMTG